jgi:hypothetical protein
VGVEGVEDILADLRRAMEGITATLEIKGIEA